ncbi:hypothetical protein LARI1_G008334 [Lachnellula arida]|uniref:2EXR domain-containing protein n=1 Tax=Lachnellula arida TaxID=1316785 RepID=A0A8T9B5T7_9HELO|nr:hypothetical protein LARI1_G008334 [Lachnellula arida]
MSTNPTFPLFPTLPTELRLKIYTYILHITSATPRILKISPFAPTPISNTPPPITLSICAEARALTLASYSYLELGTQASAPESKGGVAGPLIPVDWESQTLYISNLTPLFRHTAVLSPSLLQAFLYDFSTSPSRHHIQSLAIDLRVWHELADHGFLGILARLRALREVKLVVEFGRRFEGQLGFLEAPEWRGDLRWLAKRAGGEVNGGSGSGGRSGKDGGGDRNGDGDKGREVKVECVILTRGGEHA